MPIELNGVTVQYHSSPRPSLNDITVSLRDHAVTLLVGMTGSGKSTLLDTISGLVSPTKGQITVDGVPLWSGQKPRRELIMKFGSVFQYPEHQLFSKSVQGEFAYSLRPYRISKMEITKRTEDSLQQVNLETAILPESPLILSGGQKRRVALATTYATKPEWLFLDEPTAGLDPDSIHQLTSMLETFMEGEHDGGIIIATHDLDVFLPFADDIILLHNGSLIRHVHTDELFAHPEWLKEIGIALPSMLQLHEQLQNQGVEVPHRFIAAEEMAAILCESVPHEPEFEPNAARSTKSEQEICESLDNPAEDTMAFKTKAHGTSSDDEYKKGGFFALDPRTKWLLSVILSAAILGQSGLAGLSLSVFLTIAIVVWSRVDLQTIMRYTKPVLVVLLMSVLLSAMQFGHNAHIGPIGKIGPFYGFGLSLKPAIATLKGFIGFLCVVELGLLLPATTTSQELNQGLSSLLSPLRVLRLPVEAFTLSASLLLRFIPMILSQLQRFARIAQARGKRNARIGRISVRDMPAIVIPLLLAILKLGEDLSLAMEAKGYRNTAQKRTSYHVLSMNRADYAALIGTVIIASLLFGLILFNSVAT